VIALTIIVACIATMFAIQMVRGNPGRAVADTALLVIVIGLITLVEMVVGQFVDTHDVGQMLAIAFAVGFLLDAFYGLLAPERQRARDKKLRRLMKRRA
jgi:hypothetical protein